MPKKPGITAYLVTRNEERDLPDCLQSVSWCDQVLIVDSFSDDGTCEIAQTMGARVIQREWPGYAKQKQFALDSVETEWALNLDADERISPELQQSMKEAMNRGDADGFTFYRTTYHLGRYFRSGTLYELILRLGRTDRSRWVGVDVHEHLAVDGRIRRLRGEMLHRRDRTLSQQLQTYDNYSTLKAIEMRDRGKRPGIVAMVSHAAAAFVQSLIFKRGFLMGTAGLIEAMEEANYTFYKYAKCWELRNADRRDRAEPGSNKK